MDRKEQVSGFLELIGCENISLNTSDWIKASCPLAPWFHSDGEDKSPSFGVWVDPEGKKPPGYHCFSCEKHGTLLSLAHTLTWVSGKQPYKAIFYYLSEFDTGFEDSEGKAPSRTRRKVRDKYTEISAKVLETKKPVPERIVTQYPLLLESKSPAALQALDWLKFTRKVSVHAIAQFQLRLYTDVNLQDIGVVFPIISRSGEVLDLYVRMIESKQFFRLGPDLTKSPVDYNARHLMFGNHCYNPKRPVVLVEGPIDALRLYTLGCKNVLATMGSVSKEQVKSFYARCVYIATDNDEHGRIAAKKLIRELDVPFKFFLDWNRVRIKDAGELESVEQLETVFRNRMKLVRAS